MLYSVDATKLAKGGKEIRRKGGWDRVVFNFPHVGGVTRDVNRQVRYNQGMYITSENGLSDVCVCVDEVIRRTTGWVLQVGDAAASAWRSGRGDGV